MELRLVAVAVAVKKGLLGGHQMFPVVPVVWEEL
jgi:hypothetical protein